MSDVIHNDDIKLNTTLFKDPFEKVARTIIFSEPNSVEVEISFPIDQIIPTFPQK